MYLTKVLIIFLSLQKIKSLGILTNNISRIKSLNIIMNNTQKKDFNNIIPKTKSFLKLVRYNNILPASLLSFSGAYMASLDRGFPIKSIPNAAITVLVTCYSMIINDIFDYNVDKINKPNSPLVSGQVKFYEALTLMIIILKAIDYISKYYLPKNLQNMLQLMLIIVSLYTPLFKKIPLVKNLTCASVIAFSIFFSGLPTNNIKLLLIASTYIFVGSLMNELLLDVEDYKGDKESKIYTIPVIFGINNTLKLCLNILRFNILFISTILLSFYNLQIVLPFLIFNIGHYLTLRKKVKYNYVDYSIRDVVHWSNIPLFFSLIYFCFISKIF